MEEKISERDEGLIKQLNVMKEFQKKLKKSWLHTTPKSLFTNYIS